MFCPNCGNQNPDNVNNCSNCGMSLNSAPQYQQFNPNNQPNQFNNGMGQKSKLAAGLFGIFLGGFGVHNFYLGYKRNAIIQVCLTASAIISCGLLFPCALGASIWGLVEGILILTGSRNFDANGVPLKE